jgi:hypothetical protein
MTFTRAGQPWINQAWLMQILLFLLHRAGDLPLVITAHALTIASGYLLVLLACLASPQVDARAAALAAIAAAALGIVNWNVRPQSASFVCFGLLVYSIERHRLVGGRIVWLWPVLFALWANLHGAFIFGLALLGIYIASRTVADLSAHRRLQPEVRKALVAGAVACAATALNPTGLRGTVGYLLGFLGSRTTVSNNIEFQPLSIREVDGAIFAGLTVAFILLTARRRTHLPAHQIIALIVFGLGSLYTCRVLPWFGMAMAPALALALACDSPTEGGLSAARTGRPLLNYAIAALLCAIVLLSLPWLRPLLPAELHLPPYARAETTPIRSVEVACRLGPETRLFNNQAYGSYLAWACPELPTFIDTRIELFPAAQWRDYLRITNAQFDWEARLQHYGVNTLLVQKDTERELIAAARASGGWSTLFEDDHAVLMRRIDR